MRVLMLGWEFPPFISGGLGTACYGLTKALSRQHVDVLFVLPRPLGGTYTSHVKLLAPQPAVEPLEAVTPPYAWGHRTVTSQYVSDAVSPVAQTIWPQAAASRGLEHVTFKAVSSRLPSPYQPAATTMNRPRPGKPQAVRRIDPLTGRWIETVDINEPVSVLGSPDKPGEVYDGDMISEARRYARLCVDLAADESFDVIHAHDWMTYPAGLAVAAATGKPLVVHVHSTEFDRSGSNVHQQVYDIERRGMHGAVRVIAVSHLTRTILEHRYGVSPDKIDVVYNGIDSDNQGDSFNSKSAITKADKIVLFLGRITMQKGPEYFVAAAKKVLEKYDRVKFVIAGTGDKIRDIIDLAAREGIGHKVLFTGFLRGKDVERVFKMADVYVMPSVSEPFGIAPLEAIRHDVPVIISRTSGVAEVLTHALKVDFWDTHEIANKIIAVLRHPPLSTTLRQHADLEIRRLTWDGAATRCVQAYDQAIRTMPV